MCDKVNEVAKVLLNFDGIVGEELPPLLADVTAEVTGRSSLG